MHVRHTSSFFGQNRCCRNATTSSRQNARTRLHNLISRLHIMFRFMPTTYLHIAPCKNVLKNSCKANNYDQLTINKSKSCGFPNSPGERLSRPRGYTSLEWPYNAVTEGFETQ